MSNTTEALPAAVGRPADPDINLEVEQHNNTQAELLHDRPIKNRREDRKRVGL
jgi:hypothetical protein